MGWELEDVEKPFVTQLEGLGWTHIEGSIDDPVVREIEKVVIKNPGGDSVKFFDDSSKKSFVSERYSYISYSEDIADQLSGLIGRDNVVLK